MREGKIIMHGLFALQAQLCFDFSVGAGVVALAISLGGVDNARSQLENNTE